jgi:hypothetical protein
MPRLERNPHHSFPRCRANVPRLLLVLGATMLGACDEGKKEEGNTEVAFRSACPEGETRIQNLQLTANADLESDPRFGSDEVGRYLVHAVRDNDGAGDAVGLSRIELVRLAPDGTPAGPPTILGSSTTHNVSPDAYDNLVVWVAYGSVDSTQGRVVVHDLTTGMEYSLTDPTTEVFDPHVSGHSDAQGTVQGIIVWRERFPDTAGASVMAYINDLGTFSGVQLGGGNLPALTVDVGDRYVVWEQLHNGQIDTVGYDLLRGRTIGIATDPALNERNPTTSGETIAWEERDALDHSTIVTLYLTGNWQYERVRTEFGAGEEPSLSSSLLAFTQTDPNQVRSLNIFELATGDLFIGSADVYGSAGSHHVHGTDVVYLSESGGQPDLYAERILPQCTAVPDDAPDSAEEAIDVLGSSIPVLANESATSLHNQLDVAQAKIAGAEADLAAGKTNQARNGFCQARKKLSTFIALVDSKLEGGEIDPTVAAELIELATLGQTFIDQRLAEAGLGPCPD